VSVVTPIGQLDYRLPQAGRIRTGEKVKTRSGKDRPAALDTFKFTSGERDLLAPLAERYGGTIAPWNAQGSGDKWQVKTEATKIDVQVHVAGSVSLAYELWDPHLTRRCNGTECEMLVGTPDDFEIRQVGCVCAQKGILECAKLLRLSVLLPGMPTLGMWRWDTKSDNSITEILGFMRYMEEWAGNGLHECTMRLEERRQPGKVFKVVTLDYEGGLGSLLAGESRLVQLPATTGHISAGELEAGKPPVAANPHAEPVAGGAGEGDQSQAAGPSPASPTTDAEISAFVKDPYCADDDDDIVDAEIVHDDITGAHPIDPQACARWKDALTKHQCNKILPIARQLAIDMGQPVPTSFDTITDSVIDKLMTMNGKAGDDDARVRTESD
jgi:hypothetical protein